MTTPTLGGQTLPDPRDGGYREEAVYRGTGTELADGTISWQLTQATVKRKFTLEFVGITTTQVGNVETAIATVDDGSATFVSPFNVSYTVYRDPDNPHVEWRYYLVKQGSEVRADGTLYLRQA